MEKSPPVASASAGAATPEEKAQEKKPHRRSRVPQWTGFGRKTLWDWLQLLIVPAILIGVTFVWSATQTRSDNRREDRRIAADRAAADEARRDATLQAYLDQMSRLMLDKKLLTSKAGDAVRAVARTVTLATLRRLDGERKAAVVRFLNEARLIDNDSPLVFLTGADLRGADLRNAYLSGASLAADLDLRDANLQGADLRFAILEGADLRGADLRNADLVAADLYNADLSGAYLANADLRGAKLLLTVGLDLGRFITDLRRGQQKEFLDSQKAFLNSLSREELSRLNLSPEKLARIRREANGG